MNLHGHNAQGILSPLCLPFHHAGPGVSPMIDWPHVPIVCTIALYEAAICPKNRLNHKREQVPNVTLRLIAGLVAAGNNQKLHDSNHPAPLIYSLHLPAGPGAF